MCVTGMHSCTHTADTKDRGKRKEKKRSRKQLQQQGTCPCKLSELGQHRRPAELKPDIIQAWRKEEGTPAKELSQLVASKREGGPASFKGVVSDKPTRL